jgi:hypothetical protein
MTDPDSEILIETTRIGGALEVRAISTGDGLEVSFSCPANTAQSDILRLARLKLGYVRAKAKAAEAEAEQEKQDRKGGKIV